MRGSVALIPSSTAPHRTAIPLVTPPASRFSPAECRRSTWKFRPRRSLSFFPRSLLDSETSTFTQLVADSGHPDRLAALIDPVPARLERDVQLIKELGLKVVYVMDTHVPVDHESALGSVEDERTFSSFSFLKDKLRNRLDTHLALVVGMHSQRVYTLKKFLDDDCFKQWVTSAERYRYGVTA